MSDTKTTPETSESTADTNGAATAPKPQYEEYAERRTVKINGRFLLILALVLLALGGGTYALHTVQMKQHAQSLLKLSTEAEENEDTEQAVLYLQQYLRFKPKDYHAKVRLTELLEELNSDYRSRMYVLEILEDVLRNYDPEEDDGDPLDVDELRRRAAEVAMSVGRYRVAYHHVKAMQENRPDDPELIFLAGQCHEGLSEFVKATRNYLIAIRKTPSNVDYHVQIAQLLTARPKVLPYRDDLAEKNAGKLDAKLLALFPPRPKVSQKQPEAKNGKQKPEKTVQEDDEGPDLGDAKAVVRQIYDEVVKRGRPRHLAYVARANYLMTQRELAAAKADVETAGAAKPNAPDVLFAAAKLAIAMADQAALENKPDDRKTLLAEAELVARKGAELAPPENLRFYVQLSTIEQKRAGSVEESLTERSKHLDTAEEHIRRGEESLEQFRETDAAKTYAMARSLRAREIELLTQRVDLHINRERNLREHGDPAAFTKQLSEELEKLRKLGASVVQLDLFQAQGLLAQERWPEAIDKLTIVRRKAKSDLLLRQIDNALADCYQRLHNPIARIQILEEALQRDPQWIKGRLMLAQALVAQGHINEAQQHFRLLMVGQIADARMGFIRLQLLKLAKRPAKRRNMTAVRDNLEKIEQTTQPSENRDVALTLLRVDAALIDPAEQSTARFNKVARILDNAIAKYPQNGRLRVARANFEAKRPDLDKTARITAALKMLETAENAPKKTGVKPRQRFLLKSARARIAARLSPEKADQTLRAVLTPAGQSAKKPAPTKSLRQLAREFADSENFYKNERIAVLEAVAKGYVAVNRLDDGRTIWNVLSQLDPNNLKVWLASAELTLRQRQNLEQKLAEAEADVAAGKKDAIPVRNQIRRQIKKIDAAFQDDLKQIARIERADGDSTPGTWERHFTARHKVRIVSELISVARAKVKANSKTSVDPAVGKQAEQLLEEATQILTKAVEQQPLWPELHGQLGRIAALRKDRDAAYRHFERATELGDRSPRTWIYVVGYLLNVKGDLKAAYEKLQLLEREADWLLSSEEMDLNDSKVTLADLAYDVARRRGEIAQARAFIPENSTDYRQKTLRGMLFLADYARLSKEMREGPQGKRLLEQSADEFQQAIKLDPEAPEPWIWWVAQLAEQKLNTEAEKVIAQAMMALPEGKKLKTAAICYRLLGDNQKADKLFLDAVKAHPDDPKLRLTVAAFYRKQGEPQKALPHLHTILDPNSKAHAQATNAQRKLARHWRIMTLAGKGTHSDFRKAFDELEDPETASLTDLYTRTRLLAASPFKRDRLELVKILEVIDRRFKALTFGDRFQLARMYEKTGRWKKARQIVEQLRKKKPDNQLLIGWYAAELLANEKFTKALEKKVEALLSPMPPGQLATATVKAQWHMAKDERTEAAKVIEDATGRLVKGRSKLKPAELAQFLMAARLCERYKLNAAAERILKNYVKLSEKPEAPLTLAMFYGRQGQRTKALRLCEQAAKTCKPVNVAVAAANLVSQGMPSRADIARAEKLVATAAKAEPDSVQIQWQSAAVFTAAGRLDEAETVYRKLLKKLPNSLAIMNNLAWLLAMKQDDQKLPEALALIEQVIKVKGPLAEFLDTRATVWLAMKQPAKALADLKAAVEETPSASKYLRLALAHIALGNRPAARDAMQDAVDRGLSLDRLHPLEHPGYRQAVQATGVTPDD